MKISKGRNKGERDVEHKMMSLKTKWAREGPLSYKKDQRKASEFQEGPEKEATMVANTR